MVNQLYQFYSLRRGGTYGIIFWVIKQFESKVWFVNNADPYSIQTPRAPINSRQYPKWINHYTNKTLPNVLRDNHDILMVNYEDCFLTVPINSALEFKEIKRILIIRDPFNLAASRMKLYLDNPTSHGRQRIFNHDFISNWIEFAKEYLDQTHHLQNRYCINYNTWFTDESYRRCISNDLGNVWCDDVDFVSRFGTGSSFSKRRLRGTKLDVLNRWKMFITRDDYRSYFTDEVIDLAKQIFDVDHIVNQIRRGN